jgi:hypothetical protein
MLLDNPRGNYCFLKGIGPYSAAVIAAPGYEIVHATLTTPLPLQSGFQSMAQHLAKIGRPMQAACAVELLSPSQFSFENFATFNLGYQAMLADADMLVDGLTPVARTNIAPKLSPPSEPSVSGFSYTVSRTHHEAARTFVVAGASELAGIELNAQAIVRPNDVSSSAMYEKMDHVMRCMTERLNGLGVGWNQVNAIGVYTLQEPSWLWRRITLGDSASAVRHGVRCHYAQPPIQGLEFEMDVRSVHVEVHWC